MLSLVVWSSSVVVVPWWWWFDRFVEVVREILSSFISCYSLDILSSNISCAFTLPCSLPT